MQAALAQHRETAAPAPADAAADVARAALGHAVAGALSGIARRTETGSSGEPTDLRTPLAALARAAHASRPGAGTWPESELALCEALVDRVEALERASGADYDHRVDPAQDGRNLNRPLFA